MEIFSRLSALTWFSRLYFVISRGSFNWIKVIEDFLELLFLYLPEAGDTYGPFHSRHPSLIIEDANVCKLSPLFLLSRGFFSQVDEAEDQFDI